MTDPVLALVVIACFFAAVPAASYFKTLDPRLGRDARLPILAGVVAGFLITFAARVPPPLAIGIILTLVALYVRLMGRESEPSDGMTLGAMTGAAAAIPLVFFEGTDELLRLAQCVLAGAVSGYGITFGLSHVRDKTRQAMVDVLTAAVAVLAAWVPSLALRMPRITEPHVAIGTAVLIPILVLTMAFIQWPSVRDELRDEASLGVIDESDVAPAAHPIRRIGRAGWHDADAHREFVRLANRIALRKRQQRSRPEDVARLYQLEVIKLRMELQEMTAIDRAMRTRSDVASGE